MTLVSDAHSVPQRGLSLSCIKPLTVSKTGFWLRAARNIDDEDETLSFVRHFVV